MRVQTGGKGATEKQTFDHDLREWRGKPCGYLGLGAPRRGQCKCTGPGKMYTCHSGTAGTQGLEWGGPRGSLWMCSETLQDSALRPLGGLWRLL